MTKLNYIPFLLLLLGLISISGKDKGEKVNIKSTPVAKTNSEIVVGWDSCFSLIEIKSPLDGKMQKAYFYATMLASPQPLIVSLHTWSGDYTSTDTLASLCKQNGINYIHPDFRGANHTREACCSELALSDIDASIDYAINNTNVDTSRIYVIGVSGGGYATLSMFMKSKHHIRKFSAWVPISDLIAWYSESKIRGSKYTGNILECTGSVDGKLDEQEAIKRSPIYWNTPVEKLKNSQLSIFAGIYDGIQGSVPITHSINFYNKILWDLKESDPSKYVTDNEKLNLLEFRKPLADFGEIGNRGICLFKKCGNVQITVFTGGHEMLSEHAFNDLLK